ncbi:MAG: hypothetical protein IK121_02515, partial [Lachnospiraceae bacterium]|nr:hypothetical protein [Lachnospiraceae bacterium]
GTYVPDPNEKSVEEQIAEIKKEQESDYVFTPGQGASQLAPITGSGDDCLTNGSTSGIFHPGD